MSTDSRTVEKGNLFIPLRGKNFDGHDFIAAALHQGAQGALVERSRASKFREDEWAGKFIIAVADPLQALGDLAHFWRTQFPGQVIAITGSNGKTTTKEMTARILSCRFRVAKTEGNLNNLIGLPLTLLRLSPEQEVAVLELGMNNFGEIRRLRQIACPQISTILNIGQAHLEFLGGLEGVARAKGELWEELQEEDWIVVNLDDPRVAALASPQKCQKKTYSIEREADLRAERIQVTGEKGISFVLKRGQEEEFVQMAVFGRHNIYNALAAAALASVLGIDLFEIGRALKDFQPYPGRGKILLLKKNIKIWDDTYNANPDSLQASLAAFLEAKGGQRGLLVMGDMLELGPMTPAYHERIGKLIGSSGLAFLCFLGENAPFLAKGAQEGGMEEKDIFIAQSHEEVLQALQKVCQEGDWIMVKGSRMMEMERIIRHLADFLEKS